MPEPSTEVENVLSAIRRLIEDGRGEGQGASPGLDRLVLTPALRVPEPPEPLLLSDPAPAAPDPHVAPLPPGPEMADLASDPGAAEAARLEAPASPTSPPLWPDEAALRALVAEVLREELRGELGERLTRNLRKLVRREVMQALTLRDAG